MEADNRGSRQHQVVWLCQKQLTSRVRTLRSLLLTLLVATIIVHQVSSSPLTSQHDEADEELRVKTSTKRETKRLRRAATARQDRLWDDAVIPYEIDPIFSEERAALFRAAMRHWENYTCIKFVERQPDEHRNYIVFTERSCGCCSFVGKRGNGAQAISIGKHCDKFGIVVHELGHVVGFWHEHTRPDRDKHVQIISKNIMSGQEYNFNKLTKDEVNSLGLAYDYDSILHYATNTFAKDTYLDTILPLHGHLNTEEQLNQLPVSVNSLQPANASGVATSETAQLNGTTTSSRPTTTTNASNPLMINDAPEVKATFSQQLERDFQSMLQYEPNLLKAPRPQKTNSPRVLLLDGSVVVSVSGKQGSRQEQLRRTRRELGVDVDNGDHMLSMDNMLAKTRPEIGQRVRLSVGDIAQTNLLYKCSKCGRTIQQTSGFFHSPQYYLHYQQDKRTKPFPEISQEALSQNSLSERDSLCEWRLTVGQGERIMINITDLDLAPPAPKHLTPVLSRLGLPKSALSEKELHDTISNQIPDNQDPMIMTNCITDYLEIRDGYTLKAPIIAKLCGHIASLRDTIRPIVSISDRMLVTYRITSLSTLKRGFLAQHETLCGGIISLSNSLNEPTPIQYNTLVSSSTTTSRPKVDTSISTIVPNKINMTSSSPIDNEVLLNSQTNLRHSHLQSQQPILNQNTVFVDTLRNTSDINSQQSTVNNQVSTNNKAFNWSHWPSINTSIIQSPNWPEHYRPSKECIWQIKADVNHQISLRFDSFDLESHDSCAYDYVEIRDGYPGGNDLIGRFCGNRIPDQILSTSQSLMVKFVSDSDVNRGGFLAVLQPELDECKLGTHGCSYRCSNSAAPYRCECPSGLELAPDGKNCIPICGGVRNETSGQITSPLFPDLYPISTKCVWEIAAPAHHRITLNFTHFDLEGVKAQECDYDFVDIRSKLEDGKYVKNGVFCGPNQALVVTSIANVMRVEFNSDNSIQKSGFLANYFIDRDECVTNNGGCQHVCINTIGSYTCSCNNGFILHENKHDCLEGHCTYTIIAPEGTFHSPNFPNIYQPNKECAWMFSTAPGHRIRLNFDQFDLESHQECAYDHVAVFDGESMYDPALGRFCGSRRPLTLVSSFNMLYLLFRSDATNEKRGFNATHSTVCGGRLQANLNQNDLIYSHPLFDGTTTYNRNEDCEWLIEANYNQRVRLEFTFFALEADNNCNYDQTIVYDGADDTAPQLARLCGTDIPKEQTKITSSGESILIIFRTDDSINNRGFSLSYTAIETSEDESVAITFPKGTKYTQSPLANEGMKEGRDGKQMGSINH